MTAPGRKVPARGLVGVLSATPKRAKAGTSWLGMPPMKLPRAADAGDEARTFDPPRRLVVARGLVEACRLLPVMASVALAVLTLAGPGAFVGGVGVGVPGAGGGRVPPAPRGGGRRGGAPAKGVLGGPVRAGAAPPWGG